MKVIEAMRLVRPREVFIHSDADYGYVHVVRHNDKVLLSKYRWDILWGILNRKEDIPFSDLTVSIIYPHENMKDIVISCRERGKRGSK